MRVLLRYLLVMMCWSELLLTCSGLRKTCQQVAEHQLAAWWHELELLWSVLEATSICQAVLWQHCVLCWQQGWLARLVAEAGQV